MDLEDIAREDAKYEGKTFSQGLGLPADPEWLEAAGNDFQKFVEERESLFPRMAFAWMDVHNNIKLMISIVTMDMMDEFAGVLMAFMQAGYYSGMQAGEKRSGRNSELKNLLRDVQIDQSQKQ